MILARLAQTDPGGRVANRPAGSLKTMFLPWFRVSEASDSHRLQTLGALLTRVPHEGWKTLVNAYPSGHGFVGDREPPLWRPWGQDGTPLPNRQEIQATISEMERLLLEHVGDDANRWTDILRLVSNLSPDTRQQAVLVMSQRADAIQQHPNSVDLWTGLRTQLNRHRSFPDATWALPESEMKPLAAIYARLTPDDPAVAYSWLFSGWPELPDGSDRRDVESHYESLDAARQIAIAAAYASGGSDAILSIAESAGQPGEVGRAFFIGSGPSLPSN